MSVPPVPGKVATISEASILYLRPETREMVQHEYRLNADIINAFVNNVRSQVLTE